MKQRVDKQVKRDGVSPSPEAQLQSSHNCVPAVTRDILRGGGEPLDADSRARMEFRFGHDFSHVRVHADAEAHRAARSAAARAYTAGNHMVFGAGRYAPGTDTGERLLAHELAHVIQQRDVGTPSSAAAITGGIDDRYENDARHTAARALADNCGGLPVMPSQRTAAPTIMRDADALTAKALYPTTAERQGIMGVLNPLKTKAEQTGTQVPQVTDPAGFQKEMETEMARVIPLYAAQAKGRETSKVKMDEPAIDALGDFIQPVVTDYYKPYINAAVRTKTEQETFDKYRLRDSLKLVPTTRSPLTDQAVADWVINRMRVHGDALISKYNLLPAEGERDWNLFSKVRDSIVVKHQADLITIILYYPGYENRVSNEVFIQGHIAPDPADQNNRDTMRRGRWSAAGTIVHEMLHQLTHPTFRKTLMGLEESGVGIEGFAEHFTLPVCDKMYDRAANEEPFRKGIEGPGGPKEYFRRSLVDDRRSNVRYARYQAGVEKILKLLGNNEENLKVAYFMGRMEYLGFGGWSGAEADRRRFPGNTLGVGVLLTEGPEGFVRADYSRIILGRGGAFQLHLGGTFNYLSKGNRLGLGPTATLQLSNENFYLRASMGIMGSVAAQGPVQDTLRLDLLPGFEAGFRFGIVRVGPGVNFIIPVAGKSASTDPVTAVGGLNVSIDL